MYFSFAMFIFSLTLLQAFCIKVGTLAIFFLCVDTFVFLFSGHFSKSSFIFQVSLLSPLFSVHIHAYIIRGPEIDQSVRLLESENTLCVLNSELGTQDFVLVTFPRARKYFRQ